MRDIIWRRQDQDGHDACRYRRDSRTVVIEGNAAFKQGPDVASLTYRLVCDCDWRSTQAIVSGWVGKRNIELALQKTQDGNWSVNGEALAGMAGLQDIDLGFTPATNANAIRRLNLPVGAEAETTAVWVDTDDCGMGGHGRLENQTTAPVLSKD